MHEKAAAACRAGCGACCIAPSISSPMPLMPEGKPAGIRCAHLTDENLCSIFESAARPAVCSGLKPSFEMCGSSNEDAFAYLAHLEMLTWEGRI